MKDGLFIELPANPRDGLRLARLRGGAMELIPLGSAAFNSRTRAVAFAPALSVAKFRVPIAAKTETEARKAALYAVEDDLAQPVEDVHLTLGPKDRNGTARDVYLVDKSLMKSWTEALAALNLGHAVIIPESSLGIASGTLLDFGDRLLVSGPQGVVAADTAWPEEAIRELINSAGVEQSRPMPAKALETLASLYSISPGIILNAAESEMSRRGAGKGPGRWLFASGLALAAAGLWIGAIWTETSTLHAATTRNETAARAAYLAQFPGVPEPLDIHADVRRLSGQLAAGSPASFRSLSSALYAAIAGSDSTRLASLSYSGTEAAIKARLQFANRAEEAAFRTRLEAAGWQVDTESIADLPSAVEASLIVRARQ